MKRALVRAARIVIYSVAAGAILWIAFVAICALYFFVAGGVPG